MGLRGPPPKPTHLKLAAGNPGRRPLAENEPVPPKGDIVPPAWLTAPELEVWNQVAPVCIAMRTLTTADVIAFARYCEQVSRWIQLKKFCWDKGVGGTVYKDKNSGKVQELPQAWELRALHRMIKELEDRFGLTPAARARLRVEPVVAAAAAAVVHATAEAIRHAGPLPFREFMKGGGPKRRSQ